MSEWEPATDAEIAMREALLANDQEQYFRILARGELMLPIATAPSATSEAGWGTWTTDGRTHVLAFTSQAALNECLAGHAGAYRRMSFRDLAASWPNGDWWLAVNPGLPIEGYLPSWFVTQISRGDVRLPGRTLGAHARIEQAATGRARAVAQVPQRNVANQSPPATIERQRMKALPNPAEVPVRHVPPPDVAPPGTFLPARADRPVSRFYPEPAQAPSPPPAPPAVRPVSPAQPAIPAPPALPSRAALPPVAQPPAAQAPPSPSLPVRSAGSAVRAAEPPPPPWRTDREQADREQPEDSGRREVHGAWRSSSPEPAAWRGESTEVSAWRSEPTEATARRGESTEGFAWRGERTEATARRGEPTEVSAWRSESSDPGAWRAEPTQAASRRGEPARGRVAFPGTARESDSSGPSTAPESGGRATTPSREPSSFFRSPAGRGTVHSGGERFGAPERDPDRFDRPVAPAQGGGRDGPESWPRREPGRSLGELLDPEGVGHAEPIMPEAWRPPPTVPNQPPAVSNPPGVRNQPPAAPSSPAPPASLFEPPRRELSGPPAFGSSASPFERSTPPTSGPPASLFDPSQDEPAPVYKPIFDRQPFSRVEIPQDLPPGDSPTASPLPPASPPAGHSPPHGFDEVFRSAGSSWTEAGQPPRPPAEEAPPWRRLEGGGASSWRDLLDAPSAQEAEQEQASSASLLPAWVPGAERNRPASPPPLPDRSQPVEPTPAWDWPAEPMVEQPEPIVEEAPSISAIDAVLAESRPVAPPTPTEPEGGAAVASASDEPWASTADATAAADNSDDGQGRKAPRRRPIDFDPANQVEESLLDAVEEGGTDRFISTLLLAKVLVPEWSGDGPIEPETWRTEELEGRTHLVVFTSYERMAARLGPEVAGDWIKFTRLIRYWPHGDRLAFAVNPDSPIGAVLPGPEVVQLASWAVEFGLGTDESEEAAEAAERDASAASRPDSAPSAGSGSAITMQKPISPEQLSYYLERGYDRVSGFVYRANEVEHLRTPERLYHALGLGYAGSSFKPDAVEVYVLRWLAYRGDLYRIPYGGQNDTAMRAMRGWVIERAPFRGNGFAPSDTSDVIAEFKVDSARLPHNAQLWRLDRDGNEELIALLDADGPRWRKVGEE